MGSKVKEVVRSAGLQLDPLTVDAAVAKVEAFLDELLAGSSQLAGC